MPSIVRIKRLLKLVETLQTGRFYNAVELSEICSVSKRTIFRDINLLQDSGLKITYNEQKQGYQFYGNRFLIPPDFTVEETLTLLVLCEHLGDPEFGLPFSKPAQSAIMKLQSSLSPQMRSYVGDLLESVSIRLDARNKLADSHNHFETLRSALSERSSVQIRYQSYSDRADILTTLSCYKLFFQKRSWYAIGLSSIHQEVRIFNLGRILSVEVLNKSYEIPPRFTLENFLGNAWSIIRQEPYNTKVRIHFKPLVASNVSDVQWHKTQRITKLDDGSIEFEVHVDGLNEISWWILGYGSEAKVLEPKELQVMIQTHAEKMLQQYLIEDSA